MHGIITTFHMFSLFKYMLSYVFRIPFIVRSPLTIIYVTVLIGRRRLVEGRLCVHERRRGAERSGRTRAHDTMPVTSGTVSTSLYRE